MTLQTSIFDMLPETEAAMFKPIKSTDWKWTFADYPKDTNAIKVFSCFACGGGSTMGYKLAGCEVLGCVEIDPKMNEVYVKNHHPKYNYLMDIREFNAIPNEELPEELFHLDILDGSPPCTTFSMTGDREHSWGKEKKFREGQKMQTLDDLSFIFIDTAAKLKPKCVIMENVEGLLLGKAWSYVQKIHRHFKEIGYQVKHYLCKGEYMGIPQTRHRVFFVAVRNDIEFDFDDLNMEFNYEPILYGDIQEGSGEELNHDTEVYRWLAKATANDRRLNNTIVRCGEKEKFFNYSLCWPDKMVQTLTATAGGLLLRGEEKTKVSNPDMIHVQTFPEDFIFPDDKYDTVKYICGMSVPPVMMKRVVERVIQTGVFKEEEQ